MEKLGLLMLERPKSFYDVKVLSTENLSDLGIVHKTLGVSCDGRSV